MSISSDEAQQETTQTTEFSIPCPSCGRAMQRHQSIRPQRRHPP